MNEMYYLELSTAFEQGKLIVNNVVKFDIKLTEQIPEYQTVVYPISNRFVNQASQKRLSKFSMKARGKRFP